MNSNYPETRTSGGAQPSKGQVRFVIVAVFVGVAGMVAWAARSPLNDDAVKHLYLLPPQSGFAESVDRVNRYFDERWQEIEISPAPPADEHAVLRRLAIALQGTVPSLEELRHFEADSEPERLQRWTARMLNDVRFSDYFADRLGRVFVGTENGPFIIFRRDRLTQWLSEQIHLNRPFDEVVRDLISQDGIWTDKPAANFITVAYANNELDVNKLTGRTVRSFLGQRIDCAQCHDHPFDKWKQSQYEGLAAFYGQTRNSLTGITDDATMTYTVQDRKSLEEREIAPQVPFHPEWLPQEGTRREQLAHWVTHPENRRFERAIANRVWGLLFGKPWYDPVDGIPDPDETAPPDLLDILGADFREHNYDLRRLIHVITASRPYLLASNYEKPESSSSGAVSTSMTVTDEEIALIESEWGLFPLTRLRPEQIIGSMLQANNVKTIDQNSHLVTRTIRFFRERDFIKEYGDLGDNELEERAGTIPQALLRMNSQFAKDATEANPFGAVGRIAGLASTDEKCVETCYLVILTRQPTPEEREYFVAQLAPVEKSERTAVVEDLVWTLFNSPEFSWNH
ncbi:MAG: DUF1549 domain-containing protein [Planctomycetota bacterium]|nr:DUF1549 domain-containing protein [Planctomycetota bacterium]MDA1214966.1 DUF1549 domain-containing protein [Planctomycetota bacterium]